MKKPMEVLYLQWAYDLAHRSPCGRLKVGAIVASANLRQILALGYNGGPKGGFNECLSSEPGQCGHIHAEDNACNYAPAEVPKVMFVTHAPCLTCAIRIVNKGGFERVYSGEAYRDDRGVKTLLSAGIQVFFKSEFLPASFSKVEVDL